MNVNTNTPCLLLEVWTVVAKRLNSRTLFGVCTPERLYPFPLLVVSVLAYTDCRTFAWQTFEFTNIARSTRSWARMYEGWIKVKRG